MEIIDVEKRAVELFRGDCNCAQAVLLAFQDESGLQEQVARAISAPFGGGLGRQREVCGAVSGMSMAFGIIAARESLVPPSQIYPQTKLLCERFKERFSSIVCRDLLAAGSERGGGGDRYAKRPCERCVEHAARTLNLYLEERRSENKH